MALLPRKAPSMKNKPFLMKKESLAIHVLRRSTELKTLVLNDQGRKVLIQCMYDLSKHTLYKFLKDYSTDPFNKRFEIMNSFHLPYLGKYSIIDRTNNITFMFSNYNMDEKDKYKYNPKYIYCNALINGFHQSGLLTDEERVYAFHILEKVEKIKENFEHLEHVQNKMKTNDVLKGLY